jgi:chromosome segregation ATPase
VVQLERSIKARNNAGAAVECLTSAKAVKEEERKSSKLATISDKLCSANNSLKDKEVEIDELRKANNAISVKLEVTNDELSNANDTLKEKESIIVAMSHQQDANDAKLATAEQENAAVLARLSKMEAELKNLKEKTLLEAISTTVYSVASEVVSYMPFRKKRRID